MKIVNLLIVLLMIAGIFWLNQTYVQPRSFFGEKATYCHELVMLGYFESNMNRAAHYNCTIGIRQGPEECNSLQKLILDNETKQLCISYDDYDEECEKDINSIEMSNYRTNCSALGTGWFATIGVVALYGLIAILISIAVSILFAKEEKQSDPKLVGVSSR